MPRNATEYSVAKRFAAACRSVGAGELGDAAHIEVGARTKPQKHVQTF
jgi:hypothetical protein